VAVLSAAAKAACLRRITFGRVYCSNPEVQRYRRRALGCGVRGKPANLWSGVPPGEG